MLSLREEISPYKSSLTLPPFIHLLITGQDSGRSCICVLGVFPLFLRLYYYNLELVRQCGNFVLALSE